MSFSIPPLSRSIGRDDGSRNLLRAEEGYPLLRKDKATEEKKPNIFRRCYRAYFADNGESYADALLAANAFMRAARFFPALFITFCIELGNSFVLGHNQDMLANHFTLVLFIPVISAIAGNIGLQTSSSVTSFLNLRIVDKKPYSVWGLMAKYIAHCAIQMIVLAAMMGGLADIWKPHDLCRHSHGIIVLVGAMVNMMIASIAGVGTPIVLNAFGYDPSSGAGPFETALQDVVGAVFFVYFAKWVLSFGLDGCQL
jgi:Mg/Co/Ni transporter MgtE